MSLIIGIYCTDGLVLGADDAAHFGSYAQPTIRAAYKKIRIVDGISAISVASTVGVLQQYEDVLATMHNGEAFPAKRPVEAMNALRDGFLASTNAQYQVAAMIQHELGKEAWSSCASEVLVATRVAEAYRLYHFDKCLAPQEVTEDLPFVAIGTGRNTADPFIAHLRRIYYRDKCPNLALGIMTAVWTLKHAGETGAPSVGVGRQIVTLFKKADVYGIQELSAEQLQEHYEFIDRAEESMRSVARTIQEPADSDLPIPPIEIDVPRIA